MALPLRPLGLAHFSAIDLTPADLVSAAAKAGFAAVGLRLFPAFPGSPCYAIPHGSAVARELKLRMDDTGVAVHDIEFVVLDAGFQSDALQSVLEDAAAIGATRLSVCGDDADRGRLVENFATLCGLAADYGLNVDLENMGWRPVRSAADSLAVVRAAGAPNGGVLIDALHFFRNGGKIADLAGFPAHMLGHAQLCDARGPEPLTNEARIAEARGGRFAPGEGEFDLAGMISQLPRHTRLSVEVPLPAGVTDIDGHLATLKQAASRCLDLMAAGGR